jgi:alanine racemase
MEPIYAEIKLAALRHNFQTLSALLPPQTQIMAVVKANAYGHGAIPVARELLAAGARKLAVARVVEGEELRQAKITAPIFVLGLINPQQAPQALNADLSLAVASEDLAQALSVEAVRQGKTCSVHVKVDTGMGRIGIQPPQVPGFISWLRELPGIEVEGVFSHFATADDPDPSIAQRQLAQFTRLKQELGGMKIPIFHFANSAGILNFPAAHFSLVRPGIALYGLPPAQADAPSVKLEPALSWKTQLNFSKELPAGCGVSYGHTFHTHRPTVVGTVSAGYADGYNRLLSNRGQLLIGGRRVPIIGRICMDQTMVDLTDLVATGYKPQVGEEVVLLGKQGKEEITATELAAKLGTINYEVVCAIAKRVPRRYC